MAHLHYPSVDEYRIPGKNVLVISCIDLRLTDNLLDFLHHDNLANRYDHFALAGAALSYHAGGVHYDLFRHHVLEHYDNFEHWKRSLDDHLQIAVDLHDIRDVYIVEHEDCGAYREFLKNGKFTNRQDEIACHKKFALALAEDLHNRIYHEKKSGREQETYQLNVHCFIIDLRGNVKLLSSLPEQAPLLVE